MSDMKTDVEAAGQVAPPEPEAPAQAASKDTEKSLGTNLVVSIATGLGIAVLLLFLLMDEPRVLLYLIPIACLFLPFLVEKLESIFLTDSTSTEDPANPGEEPSDFPVSYLNRQEEALRRMLLAEFEEQEWSCTYQVLPEFDTEVMVSARRICKVPAEEHILGFVDFGDGEATTGLAFGCRGLYWCNGPDAHQPGAGALAYQEMAQRQFVNHGDRVFLGNDQFLCPDIEEGGPEIEELTELLYRVRKLMAPAETDKVREQG
jgi:hypothetical protein